jgi:hypothetical protein
MYCHIGQRLLIFPDTRGKPIKKATNKIKCLSRGPASIAKAIKGYRQLAKDNGYFEHGNDIKHYKTYIKT